MKEQLLFIPRVILLTITTPLLFTRYAGKWGVLCKKTFKVVETEQGAESSKYRREFLGFRNSIELVKAPLPAMSVQGTTINKEPYYWKKKDTRNAVLHDDLDDHITAYKRDPNPTLHKMREEAVEKFRKNSN